MITYTQVGTNPNITIAAFKAYAKYTGNASDDEIQAAINAGVLLVQQVADRALVACTIVTDGEGDKVQLWQPIIAGVTSVVDVVNGDDVVSDCIVAGNTLILPRAGRWRVTYTTQPSTPNVTLLLPFVWEWTEAHLSGNTEEENKVFGRIPIDYVVQ